MKSISPLARAPIWASGSMTRKMILSSLAGRPHHFSLRTRVMVWAVLSMPSTLKGPAVTRNFSFQPSLNTSGSLLVDAG